MQDSATSSLSQGAMGNLGCDNLSSNLYTRSTMPTPPLMGNLSCDNLYTRPLPPQTEPVSAYTEPEMALGVGAAAEPIGTVGVGHVTARMNSGAMAGREKETDQKSLERSHL